MSRKAKKSGGTAEPTPAVATRHFKLTEKATLQVMAEGFNILNRTNFGSVNNVVGVIAPPFNLRGNRALSPSQPLGFTSAFPKRQLQFGVRLNF